MINIIHVTNHIVQSYNLKPKKYIFEMKFPKVLDFGSLLRECHWKKVIKFLLKPRIHIQENNKRVKIYFDNIGDISRFINEYNEIFFGFITKSKLKIEKETWK